MSTITISSYSAAFTAPFVTITSTGTIANNAPVIYYALDVQGGGAVTNNGTIEYLTTPSQLPAAALYFTAGTGGVLTNQSQGVILGGHADGVLNADSVTNAGHIASRYASAIQLADNGAVTSSNYIYGRETAVLGKGGTITNGDATHTSAQLLGGKTGVWLTSSGSVGNDASLSGFSDYGVYASGAATVTNGAHNGQAEIYSHNVAVKITGTAAVTNSAFITSYQGVAVSLGGGTLTNTGAYGYIQSIKSDAVQITNGTIVNEGWIKGAANGVDLNGGTLLSDTLGTGKANPFISGDQHGVNIQGGGTVVNGSPSLHDGGISGTLDAITSDAGLSVTNYGYLYSSDGSAIYAQGAAVVTNRGSIKGGDGGIVAGSGTVTNGATGGFARIDSGGRVGVGLSTGGTVSNDGHIGGTYFGVSISGTGVVTNDTHGGGLSAPDITGAVGGVYLDIGTIVNGTARLHQGVISGGIDINFGTVLNNATITAGDYGIFNENGGLVVNGRHGVISAGGYGISFGSASPATVDNAGTIIGHTAIAFANPNSRLIIREGSDIRGRVATYDGASDTLRFARGTAGRQDVFKTPITNFGTVTVDGGANWLTRGAITLAAGGRIAVAVGAQLEAGGVLRVPGNATLAGGGILAVAPGGRVEIGTSGGAQRGAITVDAHRTLSGAGVLSGTVDVKGVIAVPHGLLLVDGPLLGAGTISIGAAGTFMVAGALDAATHVVFKGAGGTLTVVDPAIGTTLPEIAGFGTHQAIDLQGIGLASAVVPMGGGTFDLAGLPGGAIALHLDGVYSTPLFNLAADGHGGTLLTYL